MHRDYKKINMEYPLEFQIVQKDKESPIRTFSFNEYGIYTMVVSGVEDPVCLLLLFLSFSLRLL